MFDVCMAIFSMYYLLYPNILMKMDSLWKYTQLKGDVLIHNCTYPAHSITLNSFLSLHTCMQHNKLEEYQ